MRLPLLPRTPSCTEDYEAMERRPGGARFCRKCAREVHDFTRLTRAEAEALKASVGGRLCVRLRLDAEGAPLFAEPRRPIRERVQGMVLAAALVAGGSASAAGAAGCSRGGGEGAALVSDPAAGEEETASAAGEQAPGAKSEEERADTLAQLEEAQLEEAQLEQAALEETQVAVLSEPMRPIGPGEAEAMPPLEEPALFASVSPEVEAGQPNAEQRTLTRRKQARRTRQAQQQQVAFTQQHTMWMGGI